MAAEWWGIDGGQWVGRGRRGRYWLRVKGESGVSEEERVVALCV